MADPRDERPAPAFGEYAPEGWEWKPEGSEPTAAAPDEAARPGVPHNLGVAPAPDAQQQAAPARKAPSRNEAGDPAPYRADQPAPSRNQPQQPRFAGPQDAQRPRRTGDLVITIALLAIGAFGALYTALVLFSLPSTLSLVGDALGLADFSVPAWINTFSTVSALAMFALYAVVLIFSIQRMRAGKLAFWVPLSAGALALILTFVLTAVAMMNVPDLTQAANDPDAMQKLLDYMNSMQP
ncbi:DUF6264 family protein [Leucobacter tenebrionis]|uniref:DUF6264 family protein n=1 Tax=Leucobacter tenebrionis TaxID=2873270 RepID=UPI001CA65725|nr:DUF6264 family protein [Leucobacter tenebrionis]QZY51473.1 DUF6264 family protein [Leucobacter tenebrionis]